MKTGSIYIICFLFTSCISSNKLSIKKKNLYFKNFDLVALTSKDTIQGARKLPFVKEVWSRGMLQRIEFYRYSKRLPVKIMLPLKQYKTLAYSSRTFNGKQITEDTLISSGNQLFEFRFEQELSNRTTFYEIFHYVKLAEDSFSLSRIEVTDPNFKFH
ncbi:MAG TPA: hypothetical protein VK616_04525, partial [Flavitalea sp.]|nr:hypothetical protein [Flavitalea sp.]